MTDHTSVIFGSLFFYVTGFSGFPYENNNQTQCLAFARQCISDHGVQRHFLVHFKMDQQILTKTVLHQIFEVVLALASLTRDVLTPSNVLWAELSHHFVSGKSQV